jgi:hypothetical protein
MPTTTVPLDNLADRIAQQQAELESLRKELEARQTRLAKLNEKKDILEQRLRQLDADIEAVSQGKKPSGRPGKAPRIQPSKMALPAKPALTPLPTDTQPPKKMADLLVDIVGEAKGPLTAKPLADELQKRGFYTASPSLPRIVQARLNELVHDGILWRAKDQPGVVLGKVKGGVKASTATGRKKARKKRAGAKKASGVGGDGQKKASLRSVVTEILTKSTKPLPARELADQAIAHGYETKSKKLITAMWVLLGKMDNVENVQGEGYRLKKR